MKNSFRTNSKAMGLDSLSYKGCYSYKDIYSEVAYRQLATMGLPNIPGNPTDNLLVPLLAIYTKSLDEKSKYKYCGTISDIYQFIGNNNLNQKIRDSIKEVGLPILIENIIFNYEFTRMRNEIVIQSSMHVPNGGDICPAIVIQNSYDGSKAASLSFGISIYEQSQLMTFAFNLGEMKQVHISNSKTEMTAVISSYIKVFETNITELISNSFSNTLTEDDMLGTLDVIEKIGKKKREEVSKILSNMNVASNDGARPLPSAWQMFLAIVRYSSLQPNLNMKKLLESAAESVLVIPVRMYEVLEKLQKL